MSDCVRQGKRMTDLDELTDDEFDELLEHSQKCKACSFRLNEYEQSVLPIVRASFPEKIISYSPAQKPIVNSALPVLREGKDAGFRKFIDDLAQLLPRLPSRPGMLVYKIAMILLWLILGGFVGFAMFVYLDDAEVSETVRRASRSMENSVSPSDLKSFLTVKNMEHGERAAGEPKILRQKRRTAETKKFEKTKVVILVKNDRVRF